MSLAKAVISGTVYRAPEKRFTSNNVPISAFALNISDNEETLVRIVAKGNLAETVAETINKSDRVVVEGRLQNNTVKNEDGSEKRIVEIDAFAVEKMSGSGSTPVSQQKSPDSIVQFGQTDFSDDLIGEDEIPF
ncbi:MAG: single-stranded DNA-binding protein [Clostridium sp.]|nr:single-stranded DNA-binding protein [Clostridium sp.]